MLPNMATPTMKPAIEVKVKVRSRNSRSGRMGSGLRFSHQMNSAPSTTAAVPRPMMVGELQSYSLPPQIIVSNSDETLADEESRAYEIDARLPTMERQVERRGGNEKGDHARPGC